MHGSLDLPRLEETDINMNPRCRKTMDPDMTLSSNLGLDNTLALGGILGYSDQDGSGGGIAPRHKQATSCSPDPRLAYNLQ